MAQAAVARVTREQYLSREIEAETRSEYRGGRVYAMSGGSLNHGTLVHVLGIALGNATEGTPCVSFDSEIKLRVEAADAYFYPDAMIVCGNVEVESETNGIITNPTVVFEVLSPGTQGYDKNGKFLDYQTIPSLREVIFLRSDRKVAQRYERQGDGSWRYTAYLGDVKLPVGVVNVEIDLARLYARLRLESE
jgi:Uma2 family endonuclease